MSVTTSVFLLTPHHPDFGGYLGIFGIFGHFIPFSREAFGYTQDALVH